MKSALLASLSALTLAACAAGPDYVAPALGGVIGAT
jgi:multidrug efflux system outer membrane protein